MGTPYYKDYMEYKKKFEIAKEFLIWIKNREFKNSEIDKLSGCAYQIELSMDNPHERIYEKTIKCLEKIKEIENENN